MKSELRGNILSVRDAEDCIRATRKYTKGAFSRQQQHPVQPIQGAEFPSRVLTEYYEVYPDMDISWDMPVSAAIDWLWGDTTHIDVRFQYDYRQNLAKLVILGGPKAMQELSKSIPGFGAALSKIVEPSLDDNILTGVGNERTGNGSTKNEPAKPTAEEMVDDHNRIGISHSTHP